MTKFLRQTHHEYTHTDRGIGALTFRAAQQQTPLSTTTLLARLAGDFPFSCPYQFITLGKLDMIEIYVVC
jgi:hypothetical protein